MPTLPARTPPSSLYCGHTLPELLTVLAVIAILAVLAVPALRDFSSSHQLASRVRLLASSLQAARGEALRSQGVVWVCSLNSKRNLDIQGCQSARREGADWSRGVLVFADRVGGNAGRYDSGERSNHALFAEDGITVSANLAIFAFNGEGRLREDALPRFELRAPDGGCVSLRLNRYGRHRICESEGCCA